MNEHVISGLIAVEDIVGKLTADDMNALDSRVTRGPKGEPDRGFGVEIFAKSTGLPVTNTMGSFWAQVVAQGLENKWGDNKDRCAMHGKRRNYIFWSCTCGFVFWHNLAVNATVARTNEVSAENAVALADLEDNVHKLRVEMELTRSRLRAQWAAEDAA